MQGRKHRLMLCLVPIANKVLREAGMFFWRLWTLRRRYFSGPLLLLGVAVCLFYQTLVVARSRFKSSQPASDERNKSEMMDTKKAFDEQLMQEPQRIIAALEALQRERGRCLPISHSSPAHFLFSSFPLSPTAISLLLPLSLSPLPDGREWTVLLCLSGSEKSCLRKVSFSRLLPHQRVNMIPLLAEAFSAEGRCRLGAAPGPSGLALPIIPSACTSLLPQGDHDMAREDWNPATPTPGSSPTPGLVAMVNVYVLVTSANPLTAFLHTTGLVRTREERYSQISQLKAFFLQHLGSEASHEALGQVKHVIGQVLRAGAASSTNEEPGSHHRCLLCFQLMTFTLQFGGSLLPAVVKAEVDLHFEGLKDPGFDGQITKELILEDVLHFLLPAAPHGSGPNPPGDAPPTDTYGGCTGTHLRLPEEEILLLLQFQTQLKTPGSFVLLHPSAPPGHGPPQADLPPPLPARAEHSGRTSRLPALLDGIRSYYGQWNQLDSTGTRNEEPGVHDLPGDRDGCGDPHLRQLYTDPLLTLSPPFSPGVKVYRAEVPFDMVTLRIRPQPAGRSCRVHLDEHGGPRTANYPVGLGNSRINILVTDEAATESGPPVVMTIYTLHMYRESRPSLPMFGEHVTCGFVQDCGLVVQPGQPCGLQPFPGPTWPGEPQASSRPCASGDVPGRWVVPCLSCADNRTCDWREVAWQPEGCYHPLLDRPQLQGCMTDRKVLFIGDSTNRGMMYFLMERVNGSLEDWGKAHDTLVYSNLNQGRTHLSYSYYPQFWLERSLRPTFQRALEQLIHRSRPLDNSQRTVLVAGGVQWMNTNHLKIIREVLEREGLQDIVVVVKSLGMGFHLPVDGIRSLSLTGVQKLHHENADIVATAKRCGFEVIDTFGITAGRYKEFLQGRCACHFHEVEKLSFSKAPQHHKMKILRLATNSGTGTSGTVTSGSVTSGTTGTGLGERPNLQDQDQWAGSNSLSYHVRGEVNQVYSEILLSRLCPRDRGN
ncbi:cadherin-like and PC-esterase domain-containing protein 1 [Osmerus eperlanus]|uniref:cadherin-like and PC-esterase domain-containing protein 1 n=1 Tax=Osmerus eperlanus TaxID=29151 RepID=UPI002E128229